MPTDASAFIFDELSAKTVVLNLLCAAVLSLILRWHFERFGRTLSGKDDLARIIPFLTLIVCLIISVIKSSLALSLGLVGALSIVRFRTPIKEPEELVYLFMAIAIGLGMGANQVTLTVAATLLILALVSLTRLKQISKTKKDLYLSIQWDSNTAPDYSASEIATCIADSVEHCDLRRLDAQHPQYGASFLISSLDPSRVFELIEMIEQKYPLSRTTFIDHGKMPGI